MSQNPEISIIVPVYNVERYLGECLDSIKSQAFTDWECILIDDGSPDKSIDICEKYSAFDSRFKVIRRNNGGLSAARNTGLSYARGKFISFVDSDDIVYPEYLSRLHSLMIEFDADVVQVGYEQLFTEFVRKRQLVDSVTVLKRGEVVMELIRDKRIPSYMWNKLFKREVIDTPFPEGVLYEDMYAMGQWVKNINKMLIAPDLLYGYRQRKGSIVNSGFANNRIQYIKGIIQRAQTLRKLEPITVDHSLIDVNMWRGIVRAGKHIARNSTDVACAKEAMMKLCRISKTIAIPSVREIGVKTWWRCHLLRDNPMWFMHLVSADRLISASYRRVNNYLFD